MRPEILFRSFAPVTRLAGVGPRVARLIERIAGPHLVDLYWHLPTSLIDRRSTPTVAAASPGRIATIRVRVERHFPSPNRRLPYRVRCTDDTGTLWLVFFRAHADYLREALPEGAQRIVSGKVESYGGRLQMTHPDHIGAPEDTVRLVAVEPVLPADGGSHRPHPGQGGWPGARRRARPAGMARRGVARRARLARLARIAAGRASPRERGRSRPGERAARAPRLRRAARQPARLGAGTPASAARPGACDRVGGPPAPAGAGRPALPSHQRPGRRPGRDRRRPRRTAADDPAAPGRCRQRQDHRRPAGHARRPWRPAPRPR